MGRVGMEGLLQGFVLATILTHCGVWVHLNGAIFYKWQTVLVIFHKGVKCVYLLFSETDDVLAQRSCTLKSDIIFYSFFLFFIFIVYP